MIGILFGIVSVLFGIVKKVAKIPIKIALFPIKTLVASLVFYAVVLTFLGGGVYYFFLL